MRNYQRVLLAMILLGISLVTVSRAVAQEEDKEGMGYSLETSAIAPILDAQGSQVGLVTVGVDGESGGLFLVVMVQGLTEGDHGIHLHETGNCDPAGEKTFEQTGGHFNPDGMTHPNHAGDLGNMTVDANGNALFMFPTSSTLTFDDGAMGLADADGTALVIHETVDDLVTDPAGNSGARIACAVIAPPQ